MKKQTGKKQKTSISIRLNILFFCVFILFSAIIFQLGRVQIVDGETYKNQVEKNENATTSIPVPRGKIYDREGKPVVDNRALRTITYTRLKGVSSEDILKTAEDIANILEISEEEINKLTEVDKKDFWMQLNKKRAKEKITKQEEEKFRKKGIEGKELDKRIEELRRKRITEEELGELTPQDLQVLVIKSKMSSGYQMTPQIIKKDVTEQEYTRISENLAKLPGIDATVDWERNYVNGDLFRSVLGNITSAEEGLPKEHLDSYLVRGYNRNDRVGKSYIEQRYEDVLHGTKKEVKNNIDKAGNVIQTETVSKGKSGNNLTLTIDMELQKKVEESIEKNLKAFKSSEPLMDRAFVVMMDPKTGQLLSMAGKRLVEKDGKAEVEDFALGNMVTSYELGSAVKGATLLTGYQTGAIQAGTQFYDTPMKFKGTRVKKSWNVSGFGNINDLRALQVSSNVYMFHTALQIAGVNYVPNSSLDIKQAAFDTMRYYFKQFGLGVPTGINLPNEITGQTRQKDSQPGFLLDFSIGQYDTYTPLQLAQYISTIANDGYRIQPQIVQEIREQTTKKEEIGKVVQSIEPVVLNRVDVKSEYIDRVKEGFRWVFQEGDGTGVKYFQKAPYKPAGKTGTAQTVYGGDSKIGRNEKGERIECYNLTLVGYAPYDNPEIAFSVVVPWVHNDKSGINSLIGKDILDIYFDLKKQRMNGEATNIVNPNQ
ncbi:MULTISPECIES: peptidoglycan D,D-transpeptidase FtsI family protein [Bacillus cereus group]|uniref:peptidoglycan D,D-transpeptidase FtsI family protein n=1 Tax=Bacillus cereus group TaxID=86661 RepID=UPI00032DC560|nr:MULTISPECIES: penicillin-binding protein 2 [Bacillus cereus group]EOP53285.1 penicillin-binding protein transpeptidase [Bacillus cereus VD136]EOQ07259.1 penicillin-binding protein transpeptidase [Bacillus cereus VDM021]OOG94298.1 Cell division protein FtsI [Bacillus mycoides]PEK66488.1 penicillin-binding protein [Bacillus pseudomycoides]PEL25405.1 penicillin-binding protein [Bacillus pseudomycoides]